MRTNNTTSKQKSRRGISNTNCNHNNKNKNQRQNRGVRNRNKKQTKKHAKSVNINSRNNSNCNVKNRNKNKKNRKKQQRRSNRNQQQQQVYVHHTRYATKRSQCNSWQIYGPTTQTTEYERNCYKRFDGYDSPLYINSVAPIMDYDDYEYEEQLNWQLYQNDSDQENWCYQHYDEYDNYYV